MREFGPLREAAEKRGMLIRAATDRKPPAPREEVCHLFKNFAASEAKVVKFIVDNQTQCHIPADAVSQTKANHDRTVKTRDQICAAGPAAGAPPPGPKLSDELGFRSYIGPDSTSTGHGTFDTLTGNPLAR
jgi:hypothetical protein